MTDKTLESAIESVAAKIQTFKSRSKPLGEQNTKASLIDHTIVERGRVAWRGSSAELGADRALWHRYLGV